MVAPQVRHVPVTRILGMSAARFLREHWQKKPLLVRGAFPALRDPLTPEELAGLSCEEGIESRIVRERGGREPWEVTFGPHPESRFASLPARGWTLLVQELNRHVPEAALLLEHFAFLPNVRVDDVMVSYAAPGGSVGPHLDSYDVFLVQGMGERRWKYDTRPTKDTRLRDGLDLRILQRFTPDADEVLRAGDLLYLPPGFAHHGVAVTPCLTYSVGFRAPGFARDVEGLRCAHRRGERVEGHAAPRRSAARACREPGRDPARAAPSRSRGGSLDARHGRRDRSLLRRVRDAALARTRAHASAEAALRGRHPRAARAW